MLPPGLLRVDADRLPSPIDAHQAGAALDGPPFEALHAFCDAVSRADDDAPHAGPVRVGVLGPVTTMLALRAAGAPTDVASAVAGAMVQQRAAAVLHVARRAVPDGVVAIVLSEPGLIGAMHPTFPLSPAEIRTCSSRSSTCWTRASRRASC